MVVVVGVHTGTLTVNNFLVRRKYLYGGGIEVPVGFSPRSISNTFLEDDLDDAWFWHLDHLSTPTISVQRLCLIFACGYPCFRVSAHP